MQMHSSLELEGRRQNVRTGALASSQAPHHSSPCKHADSFALLLVLSKPKHRFGFVRRNGGAAWSFPACPGSGMERVRLDAVRFFILPYPAASQACVWGTRGCVMHLRKASPLRVQCASCLAEFRRAAAAKENEIVFPATCAAEKHISACFAGRIPSFGNPTKWLSNEVQKGDFL